MALAFSYFKIYFLGTIRNTPALFFTLIFPLIMLLITSHLWGSDPKNQVEAFVVYLNYSVQTVSLMLLGMGVSLEKNSEWSKYTRTLPTSPVPMVLGRILHTFFLCSINFITVTLAAVFLLSIPLSFVPLCSFFLVALLGGIPMALMGMTIGYAASPESSRSIFTLLNLLFLFGSFGLPKNSLFSFFQNVIPTYQWLQLSLNILEPNRHALPALLCLGGYTLLFVFLFQKIYFKSKKK